MSVEGCAPLPAAVPATGFQPWPFIQALGTAVMLALFGYIALTGPVEQAKINTKLDSISVQIDGLKREVIAAEIRGNAKVTDLKARVRILEEHFWAKHWKGSTPPKIPPKYPSSP